MRTKKILPAKGILMIGHKPVRERSRNCALMGDGFATLNFSQKYAFENQFVRKIEHTKTHGKSQGCRRMPCHCKSGTG